MHSRSISLKQRYVKGDILGKRPHSPYFQSPHVFKNEKKQTQEKFPCVCFINYNNIFGAVLCNIITRVLI